MSRFFVTGDTHGRTDLLKILKFNDTEIAKNLTKNDYLIIVGDYGGVFYGEEYFKRLKEMVPDISDMELSFMDKDKYVLDLFKRQPYTTLFIDGNHENFDKLNKYPIEEWNGGNIHRINDSVVHLMRGQVFTIDGVKFFAMGGANSVDKYDRIEGYDWWPQEMPTLEECNIGLDNLDKHDWKVDYVLTHAAPDNILYRIATWYEHNLITNFLFSIDKDLKYKHWYFGHYHMDKQFDDEHTCIFNKIIELTEHQ